MSDGIDVQVILNIISKLWVDAREVYSEEGNIIEEQLQQYFDEQQETVAEIVQDLAWNNIIDLDTTNSTSSRGVIAIFQPANREEFESRNNLTMIEIGYKRVSIQPTTQMPTTTYIYGSHGIPTIWQTQFTCWIPIVTCLFGGFYL